ncbi:unnamed protein product [Spirodela intermedia]|uniref:Uncharacterized protein n=1 Tax=Spirodela intermedia TaxID=51605 RepID=A0A7I8JCD6_SPIIN|nr:unnamed protein product [Spirodela intermedia]CAA6667052.1 unnamed protein product [Spirodela intermedia]
MADVAKDLTAGTIGGAAQLVVGHPFDTIKPPKYAGAMDAVKQTISAEGPRGLYKGMGAPLATVAAFNAVLFTVRGQMESLLRSEPVLQAQSALAGSGSSSTAVKYSGPMDVAKHVMRSEGGLRGLYKGLVPTLGREVPGNAVMFGVYEAIKQFIAGGADTSSLGRGSLMAAGGLAGAAFWAFVYPTDVIKSVLQVDDHRNPKFSGSIDAFRKISSSEGVKGLYRGFGPAMARSVPANAACFLAYEMTRASLG